MTVVLPRTNQAGKNEWSDVEANDVALKEAIETLQTEFKASARPVTWYTPKVIATEESRTNTAYGTLTTADEIKEVVLPENGWIAITYRAAVKSSVANKGRVGLFLNTTPIKIGAGGSATPATAPQAVPPIGFSPVFTISQGLMCGEAVSDINNVTTGQVLGMTLAAKYRYELGEGGSETSVEWPSPGMPTGPCLVFAAAGTYAVSARYKSLEGSVTAKNRSLTVTVLGG